MRLPKYLLLGGAVVIALAASTAVAFGATRTTTGPAKVAVATTGLGRVLVDRRGHTLYLFPKDRNGKSACAGQKSSRRV
jgi:predicted lipoprotein with Yx(FWY)xxD motif